MSEPKYVVFVRVPIARGDFVDPPPVEWDSSKDDKLWKILSGAAQKEVDWNQVAEHFHVPVDFLLQQVAFVTDRHASQVRAQVRKATAAAKYSSSAPSPIPGLDAAHQRNASAQSQSLRRDSMLARHEGSGAGTPTHSHRPFMSRNASTNTVLREADASSPRPGTAARMSEYGARRRLSSLTIRPTAKKSSPSPRLGGDAEEEEEEEEDRTIDRPASPGPTDPDETSSSDDESSPAQSRIIRRPPRFQQNDANVSGFDGRDDEDDSEPAFQPFKEIHQSADLTSTLRGDGKIAPRQGRRTKGSGKEKANLSQTSDDSTGSGAMVSRPSTASRNAGLPGILSPKRTAELAGRSPQLVGRSPGGYSKGHSSDGTPDIGSSFSDLDDTSVTQSALEEAFASHMNGATSRFSISQAFRSRSALGGNKN